MDFSLLKNDENKFTFIFSNNLNECFKVEKRKEGSKIYYYFSARGEEIYKFIYEYIAKETKNNGVNWTFAPMIDVSRDSSYYDGIYNYLIKCGIKEI